MIEHFNEGIDVVFVCYAPPVPPKKRIQIRKIRWKGKEYTNLLITYHYPVRVGRTMIHHISLSTGDLDFRIEINTDNFICTLKEVSDGLAY